MAWICGTMRVYVDANDSSSSMYESWDVIKRKIEESINSMYMLECSCKGEKDINANHDTMTILCI